MSSSLQVIARACIPSPVEQCDDCWRNATVFNFEGSYCELHAACWECGHPAQIKRHCFDCWGSILCEELGLRPRLAPCLECGTICAAGEEFCSNQCFDLRTYGGLQNGYAVRKRQEKESSFSWLAGSHIAVRIPRGT